MTTIPILLYHSVTADPPGWIAPFTVSPAVFAQQVELIAASGRTAITASALAAALGGDAPLPPRPVVVTFDDGFADFADAANVLAAHSLPSTLYVTTGALRGRPAAPQLRLPPAPMLHWSQLRELPGQGVEIGAHTHTHPQLDTLRTSAADDEMRRSRGLLEDALDREIPSFAYPHGFHSARIVRTVESAGFTSACAVMNALSSTSDQVFSLARLTVRSSTTVEMFEDWLAGRGARVAPYRERLRSKAWRAYRRFGSLGSSRGVIATRTTHPASTERSH